MLPGSTVDGHARGQRCYDFKRGDRSHSPQHAGLARRGPADRGSECGTDCDISRTGRYAFLAQRRASSGRRRRVPGRVSRGRGGGLRRGAAAGRDDRRNQADVCGPVRPRPRHRACTGGGPGARGAAKRRHEDRAGDWDASGTRDKAVPGDGVRAHPALRRISLIAEHEPLFCKTLA